MTTALVFAAAKAAGLTNTQQCLTEAVAIQMLHDFSALQTEPPPMADRHEAGSPGNSSLEPSAESGARDVVLARAVNELVGRPSSTVLARVLTELSTEHLDPGTSEQSEGEAIEMNAYTPVVRSIAVLMSCACEMGAIAAQATTDKRAALARFGHHLGLAFQLTEDILGIWGNPSVTGKPLYGDLAQRISSPLITVALQSDSPIAAELCELYAGDQNDTPTLHRMACMIEISGGRQWAEQQVNHQIMTARDCLSALSPDADIEDLGLLAQIVASRAS